VKKEEKKLLIYGCYSKLLFSARSYNNLQAVYRNLAITDLLAVLLADGFLLSFDKTALPFNPLLGSIVITLIGIISLIFIWYEDIIVQEDYLNTIVFQALKLEKKHSWLPRLHHNFLHLYEKHKIISFKTTFYIGCQAILFFVLSILTIFSLYSLNSLTITS